MPPSDGSLYAERRQGSIFRLDGSLPPRRSQIRRRGESPTARGRRARSNGGHERRRPVAVTLNGAASSDPDGDPLTYSWIDATGHLVGSTAAVSVSLHPGSYSFALTVSDGRGGTGSDGVTVIVVGDTEPPIVIPPPDITVGITTDTGAKGSDDDDLAPFLTSSHAGDWIDPTPSFLDAQVNGVALDSTTSSRSASRR